MLRGVGPFNHVGAPLAIEVFPCSTTSIRGAPWACRTRVEELEGFIDGLFGDEDAIDLPERATEALHHLGEITAMIRGVLALMERESAPPASDQDVVRMLGEVRELSRIAEKELHALVLSCTRVLRQVLATIAVDKPTIH